MAQQHLMLGTYQPPDPDEDGYQLALATTSTSSSGRTQKGKMKNSAIFTVEAYDLKWTNISANVARRILRQVVGNNSFDFYHFNAYTAEWETSKFYAANFNAPIYRLNEGEETVDELSFQVTSINPL